MRGLSGNIFFTGSYGACPKPVCDAYKALQDRQEECPDVRTEENFKLCMRVLNEHLSPSPSQYFRKVHMEEMMKVSRSKVAKMLSCQTENISLIANATTGTNAVLRDLVYKSDDAILYFSLTHRAVDLTIDYLVDTEKIRGVKLHKVVVQITMPMSKDDILKNLEKSIDEAQSQGKRIRVGIVDTIASKPGLKLPWVEVVKLLKDRQILSLVDGAHGIGQIPINLTSADPDFFVSNCHKWMYAHRGCAVFYVASRNFHLQRSALPTSWFYASEPSTESNTWR